MSFNKKATFSHKCKIKALNRPKGEGWDLFNLPNQIKLASKDIDSEDLGGFDLKQATKEHPDHLYIKIFAIKKDEPNDNGDSFSEKELKTAAPTFVGVPLFTNHQNDDVEKARGECVHSWYDTEDGGIYIIGRVDKIAYPKLARGIEEGYISGTSMGASRGSDLTLMADGRCKRVDELKEGESIISHNGKVEKIKVICKTQEHDELYNINWNGNNSLALSYEHPVLILPYENVYFFSKNEKRYRKQIKEINDSVISVFRESSLVKQGDYVLEYIEQKEEEIDCVDEDMAFILGVYAAEGYISSKSVGFCFGIDEESDENKNFTKLLNILEKKYPENKIRVDKIYDRNGLYIVTWNEELANICEKYIGCGSHKKFIHPDLLKIPKEKQKIFLSAYIDGDGCVVKKRILENGFSSGQGAMQVSSASINLLKGVRKICLRLGAPATLSSHDRIAKASTVVTSDKEYVEHILYITNTISATIEKYSWKAKKNSNGLQSKFDSFFYKDIYIAHRVKSVNIIDNNEDTYYVQVGELDDDKSDHSYILNDIVTHNCSVEFSLCSVCHNLAHTSEEYCVHVANRKNRKYSGDIKCDYYKNGTEDKCPICGSTKDNVKTLKHSEQAIFEHNYGLKFIENSFVVNPACHDCGVRCVLHAPEVEKKVAAFTDAVNKLVKDANGTFSEDSGIAKAINKLGGVKELSSLKNSMTEMEAVVRSMLKQKDNVSMDYVSDLVKAMAEVQGIFDELVEMGYAALPSPSVTAEMAGEAPMETFPEPVPAPEPVVQTQRGEGETAVQDLGGLGNVTLPNKSSNKKEDFSKLGESLINQVDSFKVKVHQLLKENEKDTDNVNIGATMATEKNTKTAASADNLDIITEKQLEKKEESLHPRTEEVYEGITESKEQIGGEEKSNDTTSDSPQVRKGTYETITEDQLKSTSALGDAIIHFKEYPDVITEKQWNDFSRDVAGDLPDDYTESITQAQIRDLLSKHRFIGNVETITEDQLRELNMTDGLKRWASEGYALNLMKTAISTVADAISTYRKSPSEIKKVATLISEDDETRAKASFLAVANSIPQRQESREEYASNVSYFSKQASSTKVSAMDALILCAAANGEFSMKAEDLFDSIAHVLKNRTAMAKVDQKIKEASDDADEKIITKADAFEQAIKVMDRPEDGRYQIKATLEDIGEPVTNKVAFCNAIKKFAQEMIDDPGVAAAVIKVQVGDNGELIIDIEDGAEEEVTPDDLGDMIEGPVEDIPADENGEGGFCDEECEEEEPLDDCSSYASNQKETKIAKAKKEIKTAQMMGGEMGGQGGMGQAPGAGASVPGAPPTEVPPVENFSQEPGMDEAGLEEEDNLEAQPPGTICPVCGSNDVDVIGGKGKCQNCSSEMTYKVDINVTKWQGVTPTGDEDEGADEDLGEGEGFELPDEGGAEMGGADMGMGEEGGFSEMPAMAASVRLLPNVLKKLGSEGIAVGSYSPATGSLNTVDLGDGNHVCLDTGTRYKVAFAVSTDGKKAYGQWEWKPKTASVDCPSCSRSKDRFVKALSSIKMTEAQFDELDLSEQVKTIVKMSETGALKRVKTASKEGTVIDDYKVAYGTFGDKFPVESCIEKLARRFGQDAVCLSGPDEGKNLAKSVCNRLKNADVYTDKLAIKVADAWNGCDGDEDCITDQIRKGYSLRQAATICENLKTAVATPDELFVDALTTAQFEGSEGPIEEEPINDMIADPDMDVDPFEEAEEGGTITLTLPAELVEELDKELDTALGENPMEEEHHQDESYHEEPIADEGGEVIEEITPEDLGEGVLDETKDMEMATPAGGDMKPMEEGGEMKPVTTLENDLPEGTAPEPTAPSGNPKLQVNDHTAEKKEDFEKEAGKEDTDYNFEDAKAMSGAIGKSGRTRMDLSGVMAAVNKKAGEKEVQQEKAQDSGDIGTYTAGENGSEMGHENETIPSAGKPGVPRDNATMGKEDTDLNPQDKPQPVIPSEDATMGHEDEAGLSGGDARYTGGDKGQGKTETASTDEDLFHMKGFGSSKKSLGSLAERIAKKLAPKEPVAKDPDVQPISDGGTLGKEEKFTADEPTDTEGGATESLIGHEGETVDKAPKSPEDHPEVFTGNAQQGKEELDSEKTTKDKGTVIAESDSESEAIRVAGRMLENKKITASELATKITELKQYKPTQIKDIEKAIFSSKGLNTVDDGKLSQPVQINEASSMRDSQGELSSKLQSLFTLGKQNRIADEDDETQLRKAYK